jgi:hypothetical protein
MSHADLLLERIEDGIVAHGGDLGGWTHRGDGTLQLFDGRVTLRAQLTDEQVNEKTAHAHVHATVHEYDDEVLDACIMGFGDDRTSAVHEAAFVWITCVAGPIKSFLDGKPVCMTCQAGASVGDQAAGYSHGDYGLPGLRAYVGPALARAFDDGRVQSALDDTRPWFRFARESAAPRRIHLAKATILAKGKDGWDRDLEIDGHEVSHHDVDWPAGVGAPDFGYLTRFAVFEFPRDSAELVQRAELERTIRYFAENYTKRGSVDELLSEMLRGGFDSDLVQEVESISTIAFGRTFFERGGVEYSPTVIRARRNGDVEVGVPLMSLPSYTRARALAAQLRNTMPENDFQALCLYNAESHAIVQAIEGQGKAVDLSKLKMYPCVVPDRHVTKQTMEAALAKLQAMLDEKRKPAKKPWWKFW